jgi:hypothetical protein
MNPFLSRLAFLHAGDDVIDVACGSTHTIAITKSGQGYAFGNSQMYQLGIQPVWARPAQPPPPPASPVGPLAEVPWPNMDVFQVDIHKHAVPNPSLITFFEYNKVCSYCCLFLGSDYSLTRSLLPHGPDLFRWID